MRIPAISERDLKRLYDHAQIIERIGNKYGITGTTQIFINAYNRLMKRKKPVKKA